MQCKFSFWFTVSQSSTYSKRSLSCSMMPLCCSARENPIESSSSCAAWHDGVSREFADTQLLMSALTSEDCARCSERAPPPTITPTARAAVFCCMLSCPGGKSPGCFAPAQGGSRPLSSVAAGHLLGRRTIHKQPRALGLALTLANAHGVGGWLQRPVHRDDLGVPQGGWRLRMILIEDPCAWAQHLRAAQCVQLRVRWRKLPSTVLAALRRRHFVHKVWPAATTAHVAREIQKSGPNLRDQINAPSQQCLVQRRLVPAAFQGVERRPSAPEALRWSG